MSSTEALDRKQIPREQAERRALAVDLQARAQAAFARGERQSATLFASDLLMLYPNERAYLETFDEIVQSSDDPLSTLPVAAGAIHVATAAGRARVLMMSRRLPEALGLLGRVFEVAPELPYMHWVKRWLQPQVVATVPWEVLFSSVIKPSLTVAVGVPAPPSKDDLRVINLRAVADTFTALREVFSTESILWYGEGLIRRRLGEPDKTIAIAEDGVTRWPKDWRLRTGLLNAYRDAGRADDAMGQARAALQLTPEDLSPLHDAAWALLEQERFKDAANTFAEIVVAEPDYPGAAACRYFAGWKADGSEADAEALLALRDQRWWDAQVRDFAEEVEPARPYLNVLPAPDDATLGPARHLATELERVTRCCGAGEHIQLSIGSAFLDSPSVEIAFDLAMRSMGANGSIAFAVDQIQSPDPRADKAQASTPVWRFDGRDLSRVHEEGDPVAQEAVASIIRTPFRRESWDAKAREVAEQLGAEAYHGLLSVLTNPPAPTDGFGPFMWTWRAQVATAAVLSHLGPWQTGSARAALYSMIYGPSDWVTSAAIIAFGWRAMESPEIRHEVEPIFAWLRSVIPERGFTTWEIVLAEVWLALGGHDEATQADLRAWVERYLETLPRKNLVKPPERRYADMNLEQYVRISLDGREVPQWREAIAASPRLHEQFLDMKRSLELEAMGVTGQEKAALDQIRDGQMDMHLRMAQQQRAQREVRESDHDPDPVVFPGQPVEKLSDYVAILKGVQAGDMAGALGRYGLDMMGYGAVATAWGAKLADDPALTEKFSRMMRA